jgi:hypothetical protein
VNLKASRITSAFSTSGEIIRPETTTDSKVLQIRCSRQPKGSIKRKSPKSGDFLEAHKEVNYIYGGPDSYESMRK